MYSTLFAATTIEVGALQTLYTVPSGYVAVVRCVDTFIETPDATYVFLRLAGVAIATFGPSNPGGIFTASWRGDQVLSESDTIECLASPFTSGVYNIMASGFLLTASPAS